MTEKRSDTATTTDARPELSRFARDVRLTGTVPGEAGDVGPWVGILRPFGGLLQPGLATGQWPPPVLSHLALGELLADAFRPATRGEPPPERSVRSPATSGDPDRFDEATVREVIHETAGAADAPARDSAAGDDPSGTDTGRVWMAPREPVADRLPGEDGRHRGGETESLIDAGSTGERAWSESGPPAFDRAAEPAADEREPARPDVYSVATPRTVLRQSGGGPDAPTTVTERRITRLVAPGEPVESEGGEGSGTARSARDDASRSTFPAVSGPSTWTASPVERAMSGAPAAVDSLVGAGRADPDVAGVTRTPSAAEAATVDAGGGTDEPGAGGGTGTIPGDDTRGTRGRGAPGQTERSDATQAAATAGSTRDAPKMTVLRDVAAAGDADGGSTVAAGSRLTTGTGRIDRSTGVARQDPPDAGPDASSDPDATARIGEPAAADEGDVQGAIANAMSEPRVVDRLYRELERRRRIERERRGRR